MAENLWIPVAKQHPPTQVLVALKCVEQNHDVTYALGWLRDADEWVITAFPVGTAPICISHWCNLPNAAVPHSKTDPWPPITPTLHDGVLTLRRIR